MTFYRGEINRLQIATLHRSEKAAAIIAYAEKNRSNMTDQETPIRKPTADLPPSSSNKVPIESSGSKFSGGTRFPNPPDRANPDPATLREQWRFAIKQYSRWYSQAWGSAILAGLSFFALGWIIKGSNPLPSFQSENPQKGDDKDRDDVSSSSSIAEGTNKDFVGGFWVQYIVLNFSEMGVIKSSIMLVLEFLELYSDG
ncbi:hypothetical protein M9H77_26011 [Catharanthus roseus]|uniref:Uncharacterized protein n=1 Tax=Catharanthus roseus TaxID=4058 RepID=A0ACC0ACQ8_CATRO|nr:hypothetical protein M9H77_26011 [Catharanthus roseus]